MHGVPSGEDRYINNVLFQSGRLDLYDNVPPLSLMEGNVFLKGAKPSKLEKQPLLKPEFDPGVKLVQNPDGWYLEFAGEKAWKSEQPRKLVTTDLLGKAMVPDALFENTDGSPLRINTDYFGIKRDKRNPFPGPFEDVQDGKQTVKVWPVVR